MRNQSEMMELIADLHLHSKYAGACSERLVLSAMAQTAQAKGIGLIATGDFTHPLWLKEIKSTLEGEAGIYTIKGGGPDTKFVIGAEVCTIYRDAGSQSQKMGMFSTDGSVKKIHHVMLAPDLETAEQVCKELARYGDVAMDGRPILKMSASELVERVMGINSRNVVFPAHLWTPWFGVLGAFSGLNSIEEAYEDQARHIFAVDMGLSSDPPMNWRVSKLDRYTLLGTSDAHSLQKMGRKATIFDISNKLSYDSLVAAIKGQKIKKTVDFYPEEGKYHYDGHRKCKISFTPSQAKKYNNICPVCRKKLTVGVLHRVEELADRSEGYKPSDRPGFVHMVPLLEIIAHVTKKGIGTDYVNNAYNLLVKRFGTEFNVLLHADAVEIEETFRGLGKAIENVRSGHVNVIPGYDGVFGQIDIFRERPYVPKGSGQQSMSDYIGK